MHTVKTRRYAMVISLLVGLSLMVFLQYASAQYAKDESENPNQQMSMDESENTDTAASTNNESEMQDKEMTVSKSETPKEMMKNTKPSPPLVQIAQGVAPGDIKCREDLQLVLRTSNGMPACVKPSSAQRLMALGWAKIADATTGTILTQTINKISLSVMEDDEVYRWSGTDGINPTITIFANTDNEIQIQNPTDTKHEFVIESAGEEVAASGDIEADGTGKLTIKPDTTGTWQYHCEYHPTTMNGTINIVVG